MKKILFFIPIVLICISCEAKEIESEEESMERFYQSIEEMKARNHPVLSPRTNLVTISPLENYVIDISYEESYRLGVHGSAEYYTMETDAWVENSFYEINEYGFLELRRDDRRYTIFDHDIYSATNPDDKSSRYELNENNLKSITADGFFTEILNGTLIEYKIENLLKSVLLPDDKCGKPEYTNSTPYVTKRGSSGIGEKIYIQSKQKHDRISIMPGYVNTERPDLFHKNNRPKRIKIIDTDTQYSVETELSDIAMFQDIPLYQDISNFEIEILDVYRGSKYDDTCISGIRLK